MSKRDEYLILGVMSGTSVDGLDLALVRFSKCIEPGGWYWTHRLEQAATIPYPESWAQDLKNAINISEPELKAFDLEYGMYIGKTVHDFLKGKERPDFVASHGHTVFHQPENGITLQIGNGEMIHQGCGLPVINDFRSLDVSLGGQGAPLVPIGDRDLFGEFDYCLNLGGIANVSLLLAGHMSAFDICPINMALNPLAQELGSEFDRNGDWARQGKVDDDMLHTLNSLPYFDKAFPKSMGLEDYKQQWEPIIRNSPISIYDKLRTVTEHAADRIAEILDTSKAGQKVLVTGGGAYNTFFMERLSDLCSANITVPESQLVSFKEAIVFAYLGLLRLLDQPNCLASVTGASRDNSGGILTGF